MFREVDRVGTSSKSHDGSLCNHTGRTKSSAHLGRGERFIDLNVGLLERLGRVIEQRGVRPQAGLKLVHHEV